MNFQFIHSEPLLNIYYVLYMVLSVFGKVVNLAWSRTVAGIKQA